MQYQITAYVSLLRLLRPNRRLKMDSLHLLQAHLMARFTTALTELNTPFTELQAKPFSTNQSGYLAASAEVYRFIGLQPKHLTT
jgi:hypothetical protein